MTFREDIVQYLQSSGLWPDEVSQVADIVADDPTNAETIDRTVEGYPVTVRATYRMLAQSSAVKFLEEKNPQHFALMALRGEV